MGPQAATDHLVLKLLTCSMILSRGSVHITLLNADMQNGFYNVLDNYNFDVKIFRLFCALMSFIGRILYIFLFQFIILKCSCFCILTTYLLLCFGNVILLMCFDDAF